MDHPTDNAAAYISKLELLPHPEGGYYRERYRSDKQVFQDGSGNPRSACTSIYYLLENEDFSGLHRLDADEIWYFHKGEPLHIHCLDEQGKWSVAVLSDDEAGELSVVVPSGTWFAAEIPSKQGFALVSCVVAPGFEFSTFELASKGLLLQSYPLHKDFIERLCRLD